MERYLYFRADGTVTNDDDETAGSKVYPVSAFRGMVAGTATALGAVTDDADAFSMFFTPMGTVGNGGTGDSDDGTGDHVDVIVVAITTDNNQKAVMDAVMDKIVTHPHAAPVITVYDKNKGGTAVKLHDDIEGITVLHNTNA